MLTLTRKSGQSIRIGDEIRIVVREVRGRQVRIGIEAPGDVPIHREEVHLRIRDENARAAVPGAPDIEALAALVEAARRGKTGRVADKTFVPAKVIRRGPRRPVEPESGAAPPG